MNKSKLIFSRRLLAIVISFALVLVSLVGFTLLRSSDVANADPTGNWTDSGNYDISWYDENENEFTLATPTQFAGLAYLVNNGTTTFSGKTVKLGADIDFAGRNWTPIGKNGYGTYYFEGTFDGQGHTISNMTVNATASNAGLFGYVIGATIKNITLDSSCSVISTDNYVGGIVGHMNGTITDVSNAGTVSGSFYVGGIAGDMGGGTITDVSNAGTVIGSNYVGGLIGYKIVGTISICNSYNTGAVTATSSSGNAGGIVGYNYQSLTIVNVYNAGTVTGSTKAGGIVGRNSGTLTVESVYYLEGISAVGDGSISTGTATVMSESNMKGAIDNSESLAYKMNEYVKNNPVYTFDSTDYYLKLWTVSNGGYPTLGGLPMTGISATYSGGDIIHKESIQVGSIELLEIYSDDSTVPVAWNAEGVEYYLGTNKLTDFANYTFDQTGSISITVKYNGKEAVMTLSVVPYLTGISVSYSGGNIVVGDKIQGDKIEITATYSDGSTERVAADDAGVTYWSDGVQIENPVEYVFDKAGEIAVTVKYNGKEAVMTLNVVEITGISVSYSGGKIVKGDKIQGDKIEITATYSDGSTETVAADDAGVTYWSDGVQIENPVEYIFNEVGEIAVTVKYNGKEAVMTLNVVELTGISASYSGGNIIEGNKIKGDSIEFNLTYSDGSTGTIYADDENVTYWLDGEQIENPEEYVFNKAGQIVVTVKYKGEEFTTLTLNVVDDVPTSSATPSASATPTAIASDGENDEGGLSGGAIAGIVTGSAVILGSGGFGISNLIRRRKRS